MDADHFDTLSRGLITPGSRRSVLRTLGALAIGGGVVTPFEEAAARKCGECKKKKDGRCKKRQGRYVLQCRHLPERALRLHDP